MAFLLGIILVIFVDLCVYVFHVSVTQTVPDISHLMPMHQDPLLVDLDIAISPVESEKL